MDIKPRKGVRKFAVLVAAVAVVATTVFFVASHSIPPGLSPIFLALAGTVALLYMGAVVAGWK